MNIIKAETETYALFESYPDDTDQPKIDPYLVEYWVTDGSTSLFEGVCFINDRMRVVTHMKGFSGYMRCIS